MSMFRASGYVNANDAMVPSLLDRLTSRGSGRNTSRNGYFNLSELRESVKRDVECLMNTRWCCRSAPEQMGGLRRSLINYGLPDFSSMEIGLENWRQQCATMIQRVIQDYEPRLRRLRVTLPEQDESLDRVLRFHIEAEMYVDPIREPVAFDSIFNPLNNRFEVKGTPR